MAIKLFDPSRSDLIRSDQTQLDSTGRDEMRRDATGQLSRVESDRERDHSVSGDVITLTIRLKLRNNWPVVE